MRVQLEPPKAPSPLRDALHMEAHLLFSEQIAVPRPDRGAAGDEHSVRAMSGRAAAMQIRFIGIRFIGTFIWTGPP